MSASSLNESPRAQSRWHAGARRALGALLLLGLGACGAESGDGGGGALPGVDGGPNGNDPNAMQPVVLPDVDLVVDGNRDGELNRTPGVDDVGEDQWTGAAGAVFLVNLDDDDSDHQPDSADNVVNGGADSLDLARIWIAPFAKAADDAVGTLTVDAASRGHVRVFRHKNGWTPVDLTTGLSLTAADIREGVELGIEGLDFVRTRSQAWQGVVTFDYAVQSGGATVGSDRAVMHVAPWIANHNLRHFDHAYYSPFSNRLTSTLTPILNGLGIQVVNLPADDFTGTSDIWFEDWMQTGWTAMPAFGGHGDLHGMVVFNPRPWGREPGYEPIKTLRQHMLGPDQAVAVFFNEATELNAGDTFDSHGNHDALPPYPGFPNGRIFTGSGILASTHEFYAAQGAQPPIALNTSWLLVGHIDETYAVVKARTATGFKLLENSPSMGRQLFDDWSDQGLGNSVLFPGLKDFDNKSWQTTVGGVATDAVMMAWNQEAQAELTSMHADLLQKSGLTAADIVPVPVIYEEIEGGKIAYLPDTANVRVVGGGTIAIFPQPWGPFNVNNTNNDLFRSYFTSYLADPSKQLGADENGLDVRFGDSWDYHVLMGDIHCASNWSAPPNEGDAPWWNAFQ